MSFLIIFAAKYLIALSVLTTFGYFVRIRKENGFRFIAVALFTFVLSYALAKLSAYFIIDPRPFVDGNFTPLIPHAADNGFPSDHALLAGALAAVVTLFNVRLGAALWILAILIGAARVAAGVHHPLDIVGSFFFAALSAWLVATLWQAKWRGAR